MTPFEMTIEAIDESNAADPNTVLVAGSPHPAEFAYGQRMSAMLDTFAPGSSDTLKIAVRGQHIRRWTIPRNTYPMDKNGYHRWRNELKRRHAEWTGEIMAACGYDDAAIARVASLIRKEHLKSDPEAQCLEDVACLVFLAHYSAEFAGKHDAEKMIGILRKTWAKMSDRGHEAAFGLTLAPAVRQLITRALTPATSGDHAA